MARFQPGVSGNPRGKAPGSGKIEPLRAAIRAHVPEIIKTLVTQAKAGDVSAAKLLLERTLPPREAGARAREGAPGRRYADREGRFHSTGRLSVSDAKSLLDGLAAVSRIIEADELTKRIEALENASECPATDPD